MKKSVCIITALSAALCSAAVCASASETALKTNTYYDAAALFSEASAETDGFIMTSSQKAEYDALGDNVMGVPVEQADSSWLLPESSKLKNWGESITLSQPVEIDSPGDYTVYFLGREYNSRGFSITMTGTKADGTEYSETYLTTTKNGENTPGVSGQVIIGKSAADQGITAAVHFAAFDELSAGTHQLTVSYSGDAGKSVGWFYGMNIYQTAEYKEPSVTIASAENTDNGLTYTLDIPQMVIDKGHDYYVAVTDCEGRLKAVKKNTADGCFEEVNNKEYMLSVYTWTKDMEPVGKDIWNGYAKLDISAQKDVDIDDGLIGLFYEDINFAADGGLYAEQIENRSFEHLMVYGDGNIVSSVEREPFYAWTVKNGSVEYLEDTPLNDKNTHYAHLGGSISGAELANKAYEGVYVEAGKSYRFSLWANKGSYEGDIRVSVSKDGAEAITGALVCEEDTVREDGWAKYSAVLEAAETMEKAEFTVALETLAEGEYADIDMVSMFPDDAVEGIFRRDLAEFIKEINPGFLRFPGGCAVEGYNLSNRYRWKDTVGPVEERPQTWNRWGNKNGTYNETYGLGFFEYFILCEYLDCKALPILNVGMACEYNTMEMVPLYEDDGVTYTEEFMEYVQDAVDLIEFANGGIDTEWGRVRAEMGHPEPFNLEMIGIGNEQWEKNDADGVSNQWFERYEAFEKFIHEEYPDMKLITSAGPDVGSSKHTSAWTWVYQKSAENLGFTAAVDEHNYNTIEWLLENDDFYDSYSRKVPVYLGEYAAKGYSTEDGKKHSNDLVSAVAEAAFLTGIERNADVVKMASYAPLFAREGYTQWGPDMIFFNDTSVYGTPNYYVQKMYSNNMGDYTLKTDIVSPSEQRIYRTVSYDEENREIIVKLVNPGERMQTAEINIDSEYNLSGHMTKKLLTSENAVDINSFGDPENVSEQISESNDAADNMLVDMPAYSFTILRISVQ